MKIQALPANAFYLASYPRSGNTWLLYSLSRLFNAIRSEGFSEFHLYPHYYELDMPSGFSLRSEEPLDESRPLIVKTHSDHQQYKRYFPRSKALYVYRDGRDVLLSFYFYCKAFADAAAFQYKTIEGPRKEVAPVADKPIPFLAGEFSEFLHLQAPRWKSHVQGWLSDNLVLPIRYEALHENYAAQLERIVDYLGIASCACVAEVEQDYVTNFRANFLGDNSSFFRKGVIGDWRNHYNSEHLDIYQAAIGETAQLLGYE